MKYLAATLGLLFLLSLPASAQTRTETEVKALYQHFYTAQNARDTKAVRGLLWDDPSFLWVSNGMAYWGADTMVERMSAFQRSEVWTVTPQFDQSRLVVLDDSLAVLFQPLRLTLGQSKDPRNIDFLVNVLCVKTPGGWRIAALYTTEASP